MKTHSEMEEKLKLIPKNRNLLIKVQEQTEEESAILLPEDYKKLEPYTVVEILNVASDCNSFTAENVGMLTVVPTHTIVNIEFGGETHSLVLESLALGVIDGE